MKIEKIRDVKTPIRGTEKSAGIDFFIPNDFKDQYINPGDNILIPSGIKAEVPKGYALIAFNKSGVAVKKGLSVGACVVDEDYQGEIHLNLQNPTNEYVEIFSGEKIVQFLLLPVLYDNIEVVNKVHLTESERGSGAFGSTGTE
jgi:dUTP pyrophosphatase